MLEVYYTCAEVAERSKVELQTVWSWVRGKKLPAVKIGKEYRITEADLKAFEESRKTM